MKHEKGAIVKEAKDSEVQKLKRQVANLKKENKMLRAENTTLNCYKELTDSYINRNLDGAPVSEVISGIKKKQKIKSVRHNEKSSAEGCTKCLAGVIKEVPFRDGKVRVCDSISCDFRETIKES